jgi:NAD+ synthase
MQQIHEQIIKGIKKYFKKSGLARAVVGVSGGIDSSLTLKLAVDALGPEKVTAISMPELGLSDPINATHSKKLSEALGVTFFSQPINAFLTAFGQTRWGQNNIAVINTKARVRAVLLYHYANTANALVLGTSNKSEILLGYGTKYGDLAADLEVIGELYKDEVYALANYLELPKEIIEKAPTAELFAGQTDESELGAAYSELDPILKQISLGQNALIAKGINPALLHNIFNRIEKNKHKSAAPPVIKIKHEQI